MKNKRIEIVEIEEGFTVEVLKADLIEGVRLEVYDDDEASLRIGEYEIDFTWSATASAVFENLTSDQLALLEVLSS